MNAKRYDKVDFLFIGFQEYTTLRGQVLFRNKEMVLDISKGGDTPYLITGLPSKHWFEGGNQNRVGWNDVNAKWALIGDAYVGTWIELGTKYLFSFEVVEGRETGS